MKLRGDLVVDRVCYGNIRYYATVNSITIIEAWKEKARMNWAKVAVKIERSKNRARERAKREATRKAKYGTP